MKKRAILITACLLLSQPASAATFVVNTIFDDPDTDPGDGVCESTQGGVQCSLRAAIEEANADLGPDIITFSLGLITINISGTPLPQIRSELIIDGRTAPLYDNAATDVRNAPPSVYISGDTLPGDQSNGLFIRTSLKVEIHAIGVVGFPNRGIYMDDSDFSIIDGTWVGVARNGTINGNGGDGIFLDQSRFGTIGQKIEEGVIVGKGNVSNNNGGIGIAVSRGLGVTVGGNYVGVAPIGNDFQGNSGNGLTVSSTGATVGDYDSSGTPIETGNQVGRNAQNGVAISGTDIVLAANYIFENSGFGITLLGRDNSIGTSDDLARNILEANGNQGIVIGGTGINVRNRVENNWIFNHSGRGIQNIDDDSVEILSNAIWDNLDDGIRQDAPDGVIMGNEIGTLSGSALGNGANGIVINSNGNTVQDNDIGDSADDGIDLLSGDGNEIIGNRIGTNSGYADLGNSTHGIRVRNTASNTLIENNDIGNNGGAGIIDEGALATVIRDNRIGAGTGNQNIANTASGIQLNPAATNTQIRSNLIGFNLADGILADAAGAIICTNRIGVGLGYQDLGNAIEGIRVRGNGTIIGDNAGGCEGNYIGFNGSDGIQVESSNNKIHRNFIGANQSSVPENFGNGQGGILLTTGAQNNQVRNNLIQNNGSHGIRVSNAAGTGNAIRRNSFFNNGGLAIDLNLDGTTPNDPGDSDNGPNKLQNTPELEQIIRPIIQVFELVYRIDSDIANAAYPISVDIFTSDINDGEGRWVREDTYNQVPNTPKKVNLFFGDLDDYVFATATDANGNTSEVSFSFALADARNEVIFKDSLEDLLE